MKGNVVIARPAFFVLIFACIFFGITSIYLINKNNTLYSQNNMCNSLVNIAVKRIVRCELGLPSVPPAVPHNDQKPEGIRL